MSAYSMSYMYQTVMDLYDSDNWHYKVRNMSDNQIMAIFFDSLDRKRAGPHYDSVVDCCRTDTGCEATGKASTEASTDEFVPEQLSFFEGGDTN